MVHFSFERMNRDDPRMEELFRLRYQVYCTECGFESDEDHPNGLEFDEYDQYARHFCAVVVETGQIIGTVRIVLNSPLGLPIDKHCVIDSEKHFSGDPKKIGEVSRLAISKDFRRREIDKIIYTHRDVDRVDSGSLHKERRAFEGLIVAGLYQCVYHESIALGLTHWYAVMAKGLCGLLRRWGISWVKVGEQVEYHGLRGPYMAVIVEIEEQVARLNPLLFKKPLGWVDS